MWAIKQSWRSTTASVLQSIVSVRLPVVFLDEAFGCSDHVWTLISIDSNVCDRIVTLQLRVVGSSILVVEDDATDDETVQKVFQVMGGRIAFAIQHGHSTKPLSNSALLSIALKTFIVQASVVSFVSDVVLGMLLSDDCLLRWRRMRSAAVAGALSS